MKLFSKLIDIFARLSSFLPIKKGSWPGTTSTVTSPRRGWLTMICLRAITGFPEPKTYFVGFGEFRSVLRNRCGHRLLEMAKVLSPTTPTPENPVSTSRLAFRTSASSVALVVVVFDVCVLEFADLPRP